MGQPEKPAIKPTNPPSQPSSSSIKTENVTKTTQKSMLYPPQKSTYERQSGMQLKTKSKNSIVDKITSIPGHIVRLPEYGVILGGKLVKVSKGLVGALFHPIDAYKKTANVINTHLIIPI